MWHKHIEKRSRSTIKTKRKPALKSVGKEKKGKTEFHFQTINGFNTIKKTDEKT